MSEDPGWNSTWKSIPSALIPQRVARQSDTNALATTRLIFVSFSTALVFITGVLFLVATSVEHEVPRATASTAIVVIYGVFGLLVGRRIRKRLDCSSESTLATSYVERFFIRSAFAEASALVGFAMAVALGPWLVYFIGLGFAIVGFVLLAPSRRNLSADQRDLSAHGCHRSLTLALLNQRPPANSPPTT